MKSILCFGDSITWGYNPLTGSRFDFRETWPAIMQEMLGKDYRVITEALVSRTTCWDVPYSPYRNGSACLPMLLESHAPLDLVIIMLGINDLNKQLGKTSGESAWGLIALIRQIFSPLMGGKLPGILIVSPPALGKLSPFNEMAYGGKETESKKLAECQRIAAKECLCDYFDSNEVVKACDEDGLHLMPGELKKLGEAIAKKVLEMRI
jgi:lysophospholipase L1-like esterase